MLCGEPAEAACSIAQPTFCVEVMEAGAIILASGRTGPSICKDGLHKAVHGAASQSVVACLTPLPSIVAVLALINALVGK